LHSEVSGRGLGTLIPDAILLSGSTIRGVVDAKYKSLHPSTSSPNGPQRDDLYQMAAYLGRFQAPAGLLTWGLLAYPFDSSKSSSLKNPRDPHKHWWLGVYRIPGTPSLLSNDGCFLGVLLPCSPAPLPMTSSVPALTR